MKTILFVVLMSVISTSAFSSSCETAAEIAAERKFENHEYSCYGHARLVEKINSSTMIVTVDAVGGHGACSQKRFEVKFKEEGSSCSIVSVTRLGMGGTK